jgi:hypothetical protein
MHILIELRHDYHFHIKLYILLTIFKGKTKKPTTNTYLPNHNLENQQIKIKIGNKRRKKEKEKEKKQKEKEKKQKEKEKKQNRTIID